MSDAEPAADPLATSEPGDAALVASAVNSVDPPGEPVDLVAIERDLAGVDRALARLDDGTYGRCRVCQVPLDDAALATDPTAQICEQHLDFVDS